LYVVAIVVCSCISNNESASKDRSLAERLIFENWSGATLERDRVTIPLVFDCTGTHK
jgi:hypothetical protein